MRHFGGHGIHADEDVDPIGLELSGMLPHGLTLNAADHSLSGTPRSVGTFTFRVLATDETGHSGDRTYTMTITAKNSVGTAMQTFTLTVS